MAIILPLIAVYGGITAGAAIAAGAAVTFAGALAVAGGMAAGLGIISGDKDFQRLGSVLSAAGGILNAAQGLAGAAGASDASSAFDIADGSMDAAEAAKLARQGGEAAQAGATVGDVGNLGGITQAGADIGQYADLGEYGAAGTQPAAAPQASTAQTSQEIASKLTGSDTPLAETFQTAPTQAVDAQGLSYTAGRDAALQEAASTMTQNDIVSMLERGSANARSLFGQAAEGAGKVLNSAGQWVQKNPAAANTIFKAVEGMYGPQAEQMDYERSLMDRARQNVNSPVRLQYRTPKTVGG